LSYSDVQLLTELRELVGNPSYSEVSDRRLRTYLVKGVEWLAEELKYSVTTDAATVTLVAGTQEYTLPNDLSSLIWVEWNTQKLDPASTYQWTRDGLDWRDTSGNPAQVAVEGRKLVFYPKPDATAVSATPVIALRYIASAPALSSSGTGTPGLSDADQTLVQFYAAALYCAARPSKENQARQAAFNQQVAVLLPKAISRHQEVFEDHFPSVRVWTRRRSGAAR
jgi:hypothetical protein